MDDFINLTEILFAMHKACPVGCDASICMDEDYYASHSEQRPPIVFRWVFKVKDKRYSYEHRMFWDEMKYCKVIMMEIEFEKATIKMKEKILG